MPSTRVHRSLLRYPGGKTRAVSLLDQMLPAAPISSALSPFVGGGSFELHLTKQNVRVAAYDAYGPLVNFWQQVTRNPEPVAERVRRELPVCSDRFRELQKSLCEEPTDYVGHAAAFFVVNRCSFSGSTMSGGYSRESAAKRLTESAIARLEHFRNDLFTVTQADFTDSLRSPRADFIFADPPYLLPEKQANRLYGNQGEMHETFDHEGFAASMRRIDVPWLITYNNSDVVRELFSGFQIDAVHWSYGMNASKASNEIVIRNYAEDRSLRLF